jgi:hypothetical protein
MVEQTDLLVAAQPSETIEDENGDRRHLDSASG